MAPSPTYQQLRQLLVRLGFDEQTGEHLVFFHPGTGTLVHLALHDPDDAILERDLVKVRALLELSRLLDAPAFDRWVLKHSQYSPRPAAG